ERPAAELVDAEARSQRFLFGQCAAVDAPEKEVEQALARGCIVERVAVQRRLRRLADEVLQPVAGRGQALEEEGIDGAVAAGGLRRVQVPSLIEAARERMAHVLRVPPPGGVHRARIL